VTYYNHTHIFSTAAVPGYLRPYEFCKPVWVWVSHKFNVLCYLQHESIYVILPWQTPSTTLAPSKSTGESSKMSSVKNGRRCFIRYSSFPFFFKILTKHNEWNRTPVVVRVARRFMPRLETESEVVAIEYLRRYTNVPCPKSFGLRFESLEWVRWGMHHRKRFCKEFIQFILIGSRNSALKSLPRPYTDLAALIIPLFAHRFGGIRSLYLNTTYTKPKSTNKSAIPVPPVLPLPDQPTLTP